MLEIANLSVTWFLIGLIWVIQIVHYPTFLQFGENEFQNFHHFHTRSITWIVAPVMAVELIFALFLLWKTGLDWNYLVPLILVVGIWGSTLLLQIPYHTKLANGFDLSVVNKLINTNWIRTVLWTMKGLWLSFLYLQT